MTRRLWLACCVLVPTLVLAVPVTAIAAILLGSVKLGGVSFVLLLTSLPAACAFGFWTAEAKPEPLAPRRQRKELRHELARIALAKAIQDAETEAGLR